jgi:four helix bundle protein
MFPFQRLDVWQRAHKLNLAVLKLFPEQPALRCRVVAEQAWRAVTSISANIAEGSGSASHATFTRYLGIAIASAHEVENHLLLARDASMIPRESGDLLLAELVQIKKMLWVLREKVRREGKRKRGDQE